MAKFQAVDGVDTYSFDAEAVVARTPTRASEFNDTVNTTEFLRLSKGFIGAGAENPGANGSEPITVEHSNGGVFYAWRGITDGGTATLVDVSDYTGCMNTDFVTKGFKWRFVTITTWFQQQTTFAAYPVYPDGADDHDITSGGGDSLSFYVGDGSSGDHSLVYTDSTDYSFTFTVASSGDLVVEYNDVNASHTRACYTLFRIECSPPIEQTS